MDRDKFLERGWEVINYICNYFLNVGNYDVAPNVEPGYLRNLLPNEAPQQGQNFEGIMLDFDEHIMKGVLHWCHPHFHAYFPSGNSFPSILADMLSDMTGAIGFSWASCPSLTELEGLMMDWWAKALGLPDFFLSKHQNPRSIGGGSIQGSASEAIFTAIMAARNYTIRQLKGNSEEHESVYLPQLICYTSTEAHSCVEKGAKMAMVKIRILQPDSRNRLQRLTVLKAIHGDRNRGLVPFLVIGTLGSTNTCAFDDILGIGQVCQSEDLWFHVDAAYAGNSFICPENRKFAEGLEFADSFNTNGNKLLLLNFDCSALWAKNIERLTKGFIIDPTYLQHEHEGLIDLRHYGIPLSRRFRALKPFFLFRTYGISGLQRYIRNHQKLAKAFEELVREDERFEIMNDVYLGLVCFRLKGESDDPNILLLAKINGSRKLHMTPTVIRKKFSIRMCVAFEYPILDDIYYCWDLTKKFADEALREGKVAQNLYKDEKFRRNSYTMEAKHADDSTPQRLSDFATPITYPLPEIQEYPPDTFHHL